MVRDARSPFRWLLLVLFAGMTAADLTAQTSSGAIARNIQDASGAVIPGATVTATNDATHTGSAIKSSSAGAYRFPNLPLGTYTVTGFIQDDIKISNNLTVNVGLRYDVDLPRHEGHNRTSDFSFTAPDAAAGNLPGALVFGTNCHCNTAWANAWYKDLAPRVGFAYVLPGSNGKLALRGGGAIIYGPLQYNDFGGSMLQGYNISKSIALGGTATQGGAFTPAFRLDSTSPAAPQNSNVGFPDYSYAPNTDPTQLTAVNGPGTFTAVAGDLILAKDEDSHRCRFADPLQLYEQQPARAGTILLGSERR